MFRFGRPLLDQKQHKSTAKEAHAEECLERYDRGINGWSVDLLLQLVAGDGREGMVGHADGIGVASRGVEVSMTKNALGGWNSVEGDLIFLLTVVSVKHKCVTKHDDSKQNLK